MEVILEADMYTWEEPCLKHSDQESQHNDSGIILYTRKSNSKATPAEE